MNQLFFCNFLHSGNTQLVVVFLADPSKVLDTIVVSKVIVGPVEPFSFLHFLERVCVLVGIVLNDWLQLPYLRAINLRFVPQKDVNLCLSRLIFEIVVEMSLDGSEQLESTLCCFLDFLLVG
jgi:hypothetical protein